jgi:hypothetical protein
MGLVDEGLTRGEAPAEPEFDINTDAGYSAILAQKVGKELPPEQREALEQGERSVKSGLTEGPARDEQGRYKAKPETPATPAAESTPEVDWEERYREAEKLIGRQGNELGELRQAVSKLEGRFEERSSQTEDPGMDYTPFIDPDELVYNHGGQAAATWVLQNVPGALENGLYDRVISSWEEDPDQEAAARAFDRTIQKELLKQELLREQEANKPEAPVAQPTNPELEALLQRERMGISIGQLQNKLGDADWAVVKDHLIPLMEDDSTPGIIKNAVVSEDAATRLQGLEALAQMAKGRAISTATEDAKKQRLEATNALKQAAQVASGSARPANADTATEEGITKEELQQLPAEERAKIAGRIMAKRLSRPEYSTSVSDGLTWGK